jgi:FAD synthetase
METPDYTHIPTSLSQKIVSSLEIILKAISHLTSPSSLLLSFNGGKDSCVMFFLMQSIFSNSCADPILTHLQENGFDKEVGEIMLLKESLQIDSCRYAYFEYKPEEEFKEVVEYCNEVENEFGINVERYEGKIKQDLKALVEDEGVTMILIGNRNTDPYSKDLKHVEESSEGWPQFTRVHPILDWDYSEVWKFINFFKFKV